MVIPTITLAYGVGMLMDLSKNPQPMHSKSPSLPESVLSCQTRTWESGFGLLRRTL
jgi:hypothetical protein